MWKTRDKNSGTMSIELIQVDIPQHPVDLHGIVTRGTKELSSTLQEFRGVRILQRGKNVHEDSAEMPRASPKLAKKTEVEEEEEVKPLPKPEPEDSTLIKPLVMQFNVTLQKFLMSAALLPSLSAEYSMVKVTSRGVTGRKAKFVVDIPKHFLSFSTKIREEQLEDNINLPSEASIDLPYVSRVCGLCRQR